MAVRNISFKGIMIVDGNKSELKEVRSKIGEKAAEIPQSPYKRNGRILRYHELPLNGDHFNNELPTSILYATEDDIDKSTSFVEKFHAEVEGTSASEFKKFCAENFQAHFGQPIKYKAIDVLNAIRIGTFDFKNLKLR